MVRLNDSVDPATAAQLQHVLESVPVCTNLGFELLDMAVGRCRLRVPQPHAYDGLYGAYHGGLLATVADSVAWFAIATALGPKEPLTTSDLHIRYLAPCFGPVTATARVIKLGRTLCPVHIDLVDGQDQAVATATVTYFRLPAPPQGA